MKIDMIRTLAQAVGLPPPERGRVGVGVLSTKRKAPIPSTKNVTPSRRALDDASHRQERADLPLSGRGELRLRSEAH